MLKVKKKATWAWSLKSVEMIKTNLLKQKNKTQDKERKLSPFSYALIVPKAIHDKERKL